MAEIRHTHGPFCAHYLPLTIAFWHQPRHWDALSSGLAPEEAAALEDEFARVRSGERDVLMRPCLCDSMGDSRLHAVRGGGGLTSWPLEVASLRLDLERAADQLSTRWHATHRLFVIQGRGDTFRQRVGQANQGHGRPQDADPDPCPLGEPHRCLWLAYQGMASTLGHIAVCRWPRRLLLPTLPLVA